MRTREYVRIQEKVREDFKYKLTYWNEFNYTLLDKWIKTKSKRGKGKSGQRYADIIITADTETSKKNDDSGHNHVCAWSMTLRAYKQNLTTLYGHDPEEFVDCLESLRAHLIGEIFIFLHNMPYDITFFQRFIYKRFGIPKNQLNVKPYYPLFVKLENGITFKDTYILAQRSLAKWCVDCQIEHQKAVGKWDYNKKRNQHGEGTEFSEDELLYIECDVVGLAECIDKTMEMLGKNLASIPYTATGIPRGEARALGNEHGAHDYYEKTAPEWYLYKILELLFHGGYTHANRYVTASGINRGIFRAICYDFSSSYPFCLLAFKYPAEKFWKLNKNITPDYVFRNMEEYAFIMKVVVVHPRLKDKRYPMPVLSVAKAQVSVNAVKDNGRILECDVYEGYWNELDLKLFDELYDYDSIEISEVHVAWKDYLPKWFTDYVFERYKLKTRLKGVDDTLYAIEKAKLNSLFGMCCQHVVTVDIIQDYETGEYIPQNDISDKEMEEKYNKQVKNRNSFLPYCWGVWCTSYAQSNLFELSKCIDYENGGIWEYSDTDSIYSNLWDEEKIKAYNDKAIKLIKDRGYSGIEWNGKTYHLGIAEFDGEYMQAKFLHSKCYVKRPLVAEGDGFVMGGDLKITVAGVPKAGSAALKNNILAFKPGFCFDGITSGKLGTTHYNSEIYTDKNGNLTADSIDLNPCDYIMSGLYRGNLIENDYMEVEVNDYDDTQMEIFNQMMEVFMNG